MSSRQYNYCFFWFHTRSIFTKFLSTVHSLQTKMFVGYADKDFFHCFILGDDMILRNAIKQLKLQTLPQVFIMHLKRFSIDHTVTKNSSYVKYPLKVDLNPYCTKVRLCHCIVLYFMLLTCGVCVFIWCACICVHEYVYVCMCMCV